MNGKLASKNFFWKWISLTEGKNDEVDIPNSRDKIAIEKIKFFASAFQKFPQKISKHLLSRTLFVDCLRYKERITEKES